MVKRHVVLFFLTLCPSILLAISPSVRAEVNASLPLIKGQMQGVLSLYHSPGDRLESLNAQMDDTLLPLTFLFSASLSAEERTFYPDSTSSDLVSVYRFLLPLPDPGIYPLSSIAVKVGNQTVRSIPSNYQVQPGPILPFLQLQAFISPTLQLYPGQRAKFVYRMTYNKSMQLLVEQLPLLQAKGFERIGSEHVEEKEMPRATMQEITQEVRATKPGSYSFEESRIEGRQLNENGTEIGEVLRDAVGPLSVEVLPFPEANQPFFFNGALTPIAIQTSLLTEPTVRIGDHCKMAVDLTSDEKTLETFSPPDIACQIGFAGFFRIDPEIKVESPNDTTRRYIYYLYPLSYHINAIPAIEVAAFDTLNKVYVRKSSNPIPLSIQMAEEAKPRERPLMLPQPLLDGNWRVQLEHTQTLIDPARLRTLDTSSYWTIHLHSLLMYLFLGALALLAQKWLYPYVLKWWLRYKRPLSFQMLRAGHWQEALLNKLAELKMTPSPSIAPEDLPSKGTIGQVREFLMQLEAVRFGRAAPVSEKKLQSQAYQLYRQLKRSS